MELNKRRPSETMENYHARLRLQQEDIGYALRGQLVRPVQSEGNDERLLRAFNVYADRPTKDHNLPFVNRKQERAYHSATPRHRRALEDHPPVSAGSVTPIL